MEEGLFLMPPFMPQQFKREEHVYKNDHFAEVLKDAVRFFHGTPVHALPPPEPFSGAGVYAIYCIAREGIYRKFGDVVNREEYAIPIYVGKAVPTQKSRSNEWTNYSIHDQLVVWSDLAKASFGNTDSFVCRIFFSDNGTNMLLNALQRHLVAKYSPLWNSLFDSCHTKSEIEGRWKRMHCIQYRREVETVARNRLADLLRVV